MAEYSFEQRRPLKAKVDEDVFEVSTFSTLGTNAATQHGENMEKAFASKVQFGGVGHGAGGRKGMKPGSRKTTPVATKAGGKVKYENPQEVSKQKRLQALKRGLGELLDLVKGQLDETN